MGIIVAEAACGVSLPERLRFENRSTANSDAVAHGEDVYGPADRVCRLLLVTDSHAGNPLVRAGDEKNTRRRLSIPRKIHM
jgi:hypothetical protein